MPNEEPVRTFVPPTNETVALRARIAALEKALDFLRVKLRDGPISLSATLAWSKLAEQALAGVDAADDARAECIKQLNREAEHLIRAMKQEYDRLRENNAAWATAAREAFACDDDAPIEPGDIARLVRAVRIEALAGGEAE